MPRNSNEKVWVITAIRNEKRHPSDQLWKGEPTAEEAKKHRFKRIEFLRRHGKASPDALQLADRLDNCSRRTRCISGACPECGRLFQRAWVRATQKPISGMKDIDLELVALSLVLPKSGVAKGELHTCDVSNLQRQIKYRLDNAEIGIAIGAFDFSFNEDKHGKYHSFWCPHAYVITSTDDKRALAKRLMGFRPTTEIPRPKRITPFRNTARRRSYSMKIHFKRRIGYDDERIENGKNRSCRNTSSDRLRADELFELLLYLDQIGFAARAIFRGIKPIVCDGGKRVEFRITRLGKTGKR